MRGEFFPLRFLSSSSLVSVQVVYLFPSLVYKRTIVSLYLSAPHHSTCPHLLIRLRCSLIAEREKKRKEEKRREDAERKQKSESAISSVSLTVSLRSSLCTPSHINLSSHIHSLADLFFGCVDRTDEKIRESKRCSNSKSFHLSHCYPSHIHLSSLGLTC